MARIAPQPVEQIVDRVVRAFDDLQEMRAVEHQKTSDSVERVQLARRAVNVFEIGCLEVETGEARIGQDVRSMSAR